MMQEHLQEFIKEVTKEMMLDLLQEVVPTDHPDHLRLEARRTLEETILRVDHHHLDKAPHQVDRPRRGAQVLTEVDRQVAAEVAEEYLHLDHHRVAQAAVAEDQDAEAAVNKRKPSFRP